MRPEIDTLTVLFQSLAPCPPEVLFCGLDQALIALPFLSAFVVGLMLKFAKITSWGGVAFIGGLLVFFMYKPVLDNQSEIDPMIYMLLMVVLFVFVYLLAYLLVNGVGRKPN